MSCRHQADNRVAEVHLTDEGRAAFLRAAKGHWRYARTSPTCSPSRNWRRSEIMETLKRHLDSSR